MGSLTMDVATVSLCVAFVGTPGVQLIRKELTAARLPQLLATTVFGSTSMAAPTQAAAEDGVEVRVVNSGGGT